VLGTKFGRSTAAPNKGALRTFPHFRSTATNPTAGGMQSPNIPAG
jgi:hypothetical protein